MRPLRFIPPGGLVEVTSRTLQGRFLLRPSPALNETLLGVLGRAQRLYPVRLHAYAFLSNHYHLLATPDSAEQLSRFVGYFHSNVAREAGRLHGWKEKFWGRRYRAILVSEEESVQVERLEYVLSQGVKDGLVASPREWPGVHSVRAGVRGAMSGTWWDRTREFLARTKGLLFSPREFTTVETVQLTPLPAWQGLAPEAQEALFDEVVERIVESGLRRREETGREPLGAARILRQDPHEMPVRVKRSPAPWIHAASQAAREALREAYRLFLAAYRHASERLRAGLPALFPDHCFPPALPYVRGAPSFGVAGLPVSSAP